MPEVKDFIYYTVSIIGIFVTGIFSLLVWEATDKSNDLHEEIMKQNELEKQKIKIEYKRTVYNKAKRVKDALDKQLENLDGKLIENVPNDCGLSEKELGRHFSDKERELIRGLWEDFNKYKSDYF